MSNRIADSNILGMENHYQVKTLLHMAEQQYTQRPDATAVIFIPADNTSPQTITVREFFDNAAAYAEAIGALDVAPRELAILVMEHSEALLYAFWGALIYGAIPSIFPFLSDKLDPEMYFGRVRTLVSNSGAKVVIASSQFAEPLRALLPDVKVVSESNLTIAPRQAVFSADVSVDDIAFLQHSSGTTGLQKGVALSHRSVLNQLASYGQTIGLNPADRIVSWLPLYHDMGLIAGFILPIAQGIPLVIMSPFHWVRDPKILLRAISDYKGTLCWLPNFAYNFMAGRIRDTELAGVDCASMRAFINCSEPVYAESHRKFATRFARYGVRPEMLTACYAMAENTFAVTQSAIGKPTTITQISRKALSETHCAIPATDELSIELVSCGKPIPNCQIRIVDENNHDLPQNYVGEIALRSDSMLTGFYHRDDLTEKVIVDGWYLTGDLGYIDPDGELYITGRKKDLIIVGGKNVYPQDLEAIANEVSGVHAGRVVVFGIIDERLATEAIVMVCEVDTENEEERSAIDREIRQRVAQQTETTISSILLVGAGWLHKSSSGKIARNANREKYLAEIAQ